jgi:hypothetical protein
MSARKFWKILENFPICAKMAQTYRTQAKCTDLQVLLKFMVGPFLGISFNLVLRLTTITRKVTMTRDERRY